MKLEKKHHDESFSEKQEVGDIIRQGVSGGYYSLECYRLLIQLFRERLSEKNVHATIPKGNIGYDQYAVANKVAVESSIVAFLQHLQTYVHGSRVIPSNFFEEQ